MLASNDILGHVRDHPYEGWQVELWGLPVTLMSSAIASMIVVAVVLVVVLVPLTRRWQRVPHGGAAVLEMLVLFVRDFIARPALHEKANAYLPYLLTLFVFILGMNIIGILPLAQVTLFVNEHWLPWFPVFGGTPTGIASVCAALAGMTLAAILLVGAYRHARHWHEAKRWPLALCLLIAPGLWLRGLAPSVPGNVGRVLAGPLMVLELIGVLAKCFSLMVRLLANMLAGHVLLAVLMYLLARTLQEAVLHAVYIGPAVVIGSALVDVLELMVAVLQAYIFTFLSAMFLGLYVETEH